MKTIRNVTFVVLCALVYAMPTSVQAATPICNIGGSGMWHPQYVGECPSGIYCGDAFANAIEHCDGGLMVGFWCNDFVGGGATFSFSCEPWFD